MTEPGDEPVLEPPDAPPDDLLSPIPLPEVRTSVRAQRRASQRERKRPWGLLAGLLALVLLTGYIVLDGRSPGAIDSDAKSPTAKVAEINRHAVLFAVSDGTGRASTMALLVPAEGGKGGTVLLVPAGTLTEISGLGPQPVGRALSVGGPSQLKSTTENLLGANIESITVLAPDALATTFEPVGSLRIDVPEQVESVADDGVVTVLFRPGPTNLQPDKVADYLSAPGQGSDLKRLARHQTFWESLIAAGVKAPDRLAGLPDPLATVIKSLAGGSVQVRLLPVKSFGSTPTDGELYKADEAEVRRTVDQVLGTSTEPRSRVRILNGTGTLELARQVEQKLGPADVQVTITGNADRLNYKTTEIIYYDPVDRDVAQRVQAALGVGTLIHNRNQTDVVDVTIIVGRDFEAE